MTTKQQKPKEQIDTVVIRFAGDSGDGMQLDWKSVYRKYSYFW